LVSAGAGDDFIHFGSALTSADSVDGGLGYDTVGLLGDTTVIFGATTMVGVEKLAVYSSGGAGTFDYNITMADNNVATGGNMMVVAQSLLPSETLTFDGSAELDGTFNVRGGKGADSITGGAKADQIWGNLGADTLRGGGGKDQFEYFAANESTAAQRDTILDFTLGDKINLQAIDADNDAANGNGKFTFVGSGVFTGTAGELRVFGSNGSWTVEADTNGDSVADLVIGVNTTGGHILGGADFYL
jgi:Ca2+-binding RTX toxin-like protein